MARLPSPGDRDPGTQHHTTPDDPRRAAPTTLDADPDAAGLVDSGSEHDEDPEVGEDADVDEDAEQDLQVEPHVLESDEAHEAGYSGLSQRERDELDELADRIARRAADKELIAELAETGFSGPGYDAFADDLARYALSVFGGWLRTGHVFSLTRALSPSEVELLEFADDRDSRSELAAMTIATALPKFRQKALIEGGWDPEKGASLTTYFMRACVFAFPNQLRAQRRLRNKWRRQDDSSTRGELVDLDRGVINDPADLAVGKTRVVDHLRGLDERTARLVAAIIDDYSQAEMVELFPEDSVRAVEGVIYRWRTHEQKKLSEQSAEEAREIREERR